MMQYALVLAGALLASAHEGQAHGRFHRYNKRVVVTDTEIDYVTVTEYVTAGEPAPTAYSSPQAPAYTAPAASSSSEAAPVAESSSSAAPSTTLVTSVSSASPTSAASAPAPSSYAQNKAAPSDYGSSSAESSAAAPSSYASSSAASSSKPSSTGISSSNLTPGGKKHGFSGYVGIQDTQAFSDLAPYISWYSDYTPNTPDEQGVLGVGMLWGADGSPCGSVETDRLSTYNSLVSNDTVPSIMFGFYEPDCECPMSADMSTSDAATQWDSLLAPLADKGTVLGSPSMCKQYDEDFLTPFKGAISTDWDVTSIHINKPNVSEAQKDVEYYYNTYGKPIWVSEFACVIDQPSWEPCTDQTQIDSFINDVVKYFEGNDNVVAYGPSNGEGLGTAWPLTDSSTGELTTTGQTYLNAIKSL